MGKARAPAQDPSTDLFAQLCHHVDVVAVRRASAADHYRGHEVGLLDARRQLVRGDLVPAQTGENIWSSWYTMLRVLLVRVHSSCILHIELRALDLVRNDE